MSRPNKISQENEESERKIERHLCEIVKAAGGVCLKYYNPVAAGYPDRVILMRGVPDIWVELKSAGKRPTPLQSHRMQSLRDLGRSVYVCDSKAKADEILRQIRQKYGI